MRRVIRRPRPRAVSVRLPWPMACALVLLSLPAWDQIFAVPRDPLDNSGLYKLSGTVVNSATGEPVQRALVQFYLGRDQAMLTDAEGRFEFGGLDGERADIFLKDYPNDGVKK